MAKYVTVQVTRKEPAGPAVEGVERCKKCSQPLSAAELQQSLKVCPHCGHHYPVSAPERIAQLADPGSVHLIGEELRPADPLDFFDLRPYPERVSEAQAGTGMTEAFSAASCRIDGRRVGLGVLDFRFMGGSMGAVLGERFFRLVQAAVDNRAPVIVVAASGGARMQEGLFSLMQMAKTVVAVQLLREAHLPYITVLTHPTTGGVLASFCTVADIIMAEPKAVIRFAGTRVIEQTTREKLPPGFDHAEAILSYGQLDMIVDRRELRQTLAKTLALLMGEPGDGAR
jgi:acetyl-CoA carboxylase carboxyl transferase subunit beta